MLIDEDGPGNERFRIAAAVAVWPTADAGQMRLGGQWACNFGKCHAKPKSESGVEMRDEFMLMDDIQFSQGVC